MTRNTKAFDSSKKGEKRRSQTHKNAAPRSGSIEEDCNRFHVANTNENGNSTTTNAFDILMNSRSKPSAVSDNGTDKEILDDGLDPANRSSQDGLKRRLDEDISLRFPTPTPSSIDSMEEQHSHKRFKRASESSNSTAIIKWTYKSTDSFDMDAVIVNENTIGECKLNSEHGTNSVSGNLPQSMPATKRDEQSSTESHLEITVTGDDNLEGSNSAPSSKRDSAKNKVLTKPSHSKGRRRYKRKQQSNEALPVTAPAITIETRKTPLAAKTKMANGDQKQTNNQQDTKRAACKRGRKTKSLRNDAHEISPEVNKPLKLQPSTTIVLDDDKDDCSGTLAPFFKSSNGGNNETEPKQQSSFLFSGRALGSPSRFNRVRNTEFTIIQSDTYDMDILFPKVSHVRQIEKECKLDEATTSSSLSLGVNKVKLIWHNLLEIKEDKPAEGHFHKRNDIFSDITVPDLLQIETMSKIKLDAGRSFFKDVKDKREIIRKWKTAFERFPTYKCFNIMRLRHMNTDGSDMESSLDSSNDVKEEQKVFDCPTNESLPPQNGEELFLDKYKANVFEDILINLGPVIELQKFLSKWTENQKKDCHKKKEKVDKSYKMTCFNKDDPYANTVVLIGPISSGKTSAVYALANSMNFNILEINASMTRNGRRLIQELQESTQSHQVRKTKVTETANETIDTLWNKVKSKTPTAKESKLSKAERKSNGCRNELQSLLLIEDADILMDKFDVGFLDAIHTLSSNSKRPVVIVVNDENCACLQKFPTLRKIQFRASQPLNVAKYMCILSLVENCPISLYDCLDLYCYNNQDLRKSLQQIQFFIQSGGDYVHTNADQRILANAETNRQKNRVVDNLTNLFEESKINTHSSLLRYFVYDMRTSNMLTLPVYLRLVSKYLTRMLQEYANSPPNIKEEPVNDTSNFRTGTSLHNICRFYNNLSTASTLIGRNTIMLNMADNMNIYNNCIDITDYTTTNILPTITHYLTTQSFKVLLQENAEEAVYDYSPQTDCWKREFIYKRLYFMPAFCSSVSLHLDYEPTLRAICRSEFQRSKSERRCTRFHHYLQAYTRNMYISCQDMYEQTCIVLQ